MKKYLIVFALLLSSVVFAEDCEFVNNSYDYINYDNYIEPSQAIFESELSNFIENNYGSSSNSEYLNSPKSEDSGGDSFDRNY